MKQLQSWFTNISSHFAACLHLQEGGQVGEAGMAASPKSSSGKPIGSSYPGWFDF